MARDETPPFPRGETFYNGSPIDTTNLGGVNIEGKVYRFEQNSPDNQQNDDGSGRYVLVKVVRNVAGANLKPARVAHYKADDPYETHIDGYCTAAGDRPAGVIDELLPAAGVVNNDLFYVVIGGPTFVTQLHAGNSSLVIGDRLVPATSGASATDDLAGRVIKADFTGATTTLAYNIINQFAFSGVVNNTIDAVIKVVVRTIGNN